MEMHGNLYPLESYFNTIITLDSYQVQLGLDYLKAASLA